MNILKSEKATWIGFISLFIVALFNSRLLAAMDHPLYYILLFAWLFCVMLWLAFSVVRHADALAVKLGEPYGTLILTISVISIEVIMIGAIMLTGEHSPTLARDSMFAVLMIVLNGMLGVALLIGGLKHHEQAFNLKGAKTYLSVIFSLAILGLVIPRLTTSAPAGTVSLHMGIFLIIISIALYVVFLLIQTRGYSHYFNMPDDEQDHDMLAHSVGYHTLFLILSMLPIVLLSKKMALLVDFGIAQLGAPQALAGFLVAILVLSPEAVSAMKAALHNRLQRTVNISLGSALATIGLTIPAALAISYVIGVNIELGLTQVQIAILMLTLFVTLINFGTGKTNVLQGAIHIIIFAAYIILIFE